MLRPGDKREQFIVLMARLESARGPDREIDYLVGLVTGHPLLTPDRVLNRKAGGYIDRRVPRYTASIDAALELVSGWGSWTLHSTDDHDLASFELTDGRNHLGQPHTDAATPALSVCIAATLINNAGGFVEACRIADAGAST